MPTNNNRKSPRTYRIVGPQQQVDERDTPHPRIARGELGERMRLRYKNRGEQDAFRRSCEYSGYQKGGLTNDFIYAIKQAPAGGVNPERFQVTDPADMARKVKEAARFFGADLVGITHLDQAYVYSHRGRDNPGTGEKAGDPIHLDHKYAICLGFAGDFERFMSAPSNIASAEYQGGQKFAYIPTFMVAAYIRELGYPARTHGLGGGDVNPIPLAVNAGLGELGRHGQLLHEEYGSRLHLFVVTTDLPMAVDEPVDMGVEDVCRVCMKCATTCPTYSIPFGDKEVVNGVEKWVVNSDTCYKYKLAAEGPWTLCLNCTNYCCYNKRSAWWHTLAGWILKKLPIPLRPFYIKPLLLMDDLIWGKRPKINMQWMGYDNTTKAKTVTCNIPGCIAKHKPLEQKPLHKIPKPGVRAQA